MVLFLDDFYLKSPVNELIFNECLERLENDTSIKCFTFAWQPGPNHSDRIQPEFEIRGRFAKYRVNAQIGLWRVDYLKKILRTYETPWQFELSGSFRSSIIGGKMLSLKKDSPLVFDYDHGFLIIRGRINRKVSNYFSIFEGLDMNLPYEDYHEIAIPNKRNRICRMVIYAKDMVISLFRK